MAQGTHVHPRRRGQRSAYSILSIHQVVVLIVGLVIPSTLAGQSFKVLPVPPRYQETPVWCWVAVGEMVFRYYGIPNMNGPGNYQCGVIGALAGPYSPCWGNCS